MANIPVYTSDQPTPQPNNMVEAAYLRKGENAGRIAGAVGDLVDIGLDVHRRIQEQRAIEESTNLAADLATTQADLQVKLEEAKKNADPNSEDFKDWSANFNANVVDPAVDKLGQGLTTRTAQRQLKETQAKLRGMFYVKTNAEQAELSGAAAVQNIMTLGNVQAASVRDNPATFEISLGIIDHSIAGMIAAGYPRAQAEALQRSLNAGVAEAAFKGAAELNPDKAQKDLDAGRYSAYLPEGKQDELRDYVETQKKAADIERRRVVADKEKEVKAASDAAESDYTSRLIIAPGKLSPKEIASDPRLSGDQKRVLFNFQEARLKPGSDELKTDNQLYISLFNRIHAPDGDPRKITDENDLYQFFGKGLNATSLGQLRGEISGKRTQEGQVEADLKRAFVEKARRKLTGTNELLGIRDPKGDDNLYQFMQQFLPAFDKAIKTGQNPVELLAPGGMFDKGLDQYTRSPQQMMQDLMGNRPTTAAPETIPQPKTKAEYDALPKGARYRYTDGSVRVKP